ncbi:MAG TPA: spore coat protein GerQ [Bacillales bacterium]|nr:spore coat protein GerQ [Bacillales bacterium]
MADHDNRNAGSPAQGQGGMQTNPYTGAYQGGVPQQGGYQPYGQSIPFGFASAQGQQPYGGGGGGFPSPTAYHGAPPTGYPQQFGAPQQVIQQPQESFIENILRMNAGEVCTVYMSFENDAPWANKVFKGVIEAAGKDHLILRDLKSTERYLLLMVYVNFVTFPNQINYYYPYAPQFTSIAE